MGYDILIRDGKAVYDGDVLVTHTEIKRLLTNRQWTTSTVTPQQLRACSRIFAAVMAQDFVRNEPMYAFLQGMYDSSAGGARVTDEIVREHALAMTGELPEQGSSTMTSIEFPAFEGGNEEWSNLARVSAGGFTDLEWATSCAVHDHNVHGAHLALHMPAKWVDRAWAPPAKT